MCPDAKWLSRRSQTASRQLAGAVCHGSQLSSSLLSLEPSFLLPNASVGTSRTTSLDSVCLTERAMSAAGLDVHALALTHYTTCAPRLHAGSIPV